MIAEDEGARIRRYPLDCQDDAGTWHVVAKNAGGQDLLYPHRIFTVKGPAPSLPQVFAPSVAMARRVRLRVLEASQPPRIVEIAAAAIGGTRSNLPFWYRHGFEKVLSPPQGPRVARPVEVARELR